MLVIPIVIHGNQWIIFCMYVHRLKVLYYDPMGRRMSINEKKIFSFLVRYI